MKFILLLCLGLHSSFLFAQQCDSITKMLSCRLGCGIVPAFDQSLVRLMSSNTRGNNECLFIVDGLPVDSSDIKALKPKSIKSVEVLEASSMNKFISCKAVKSVILIQTKKVSDCRLLVLDEIDSLPIVGATVKIPHIKTVLSSNESGVVTIPTMANGIETSFDIRSIGYEQKIQQLQFETNSQQVVVFLKRDVKSLTNVTIVSYETHRLRCIGCGLRVTRVYNYGNTKKNSPIPSFTTYPNPVRKGGTILVSFDQNLEASFQVLSVTGQVLYTGKTILLKEKPFPIPVGSWPAGTYFIRFIVAGTARNITQKFIVQ